MIATVINALLVILGSAVGLLFKDKINKKIADALVVGLALCVCLIGIQSAIKTTDTMGVILCMAFGIIIGELLHIEDKLDSLGDSIKKRFMKGRDTGRFTEGFMSAVLLFCVGSMAIMGAMEAGINKDYSIILSKSILDCITSVSFAATMGVGVAFSAIVILVYQGLLTLLAMLVGPFLSIQVINEMSAVGGLLIMALSYNIMGLSGENKLRVGNMLPAIFLPILYIPLAEWISGIF